MYRLCLLLMNHLLTYKIELQKVLNRTQSQFVFQTYDHLVTTFRFQSMIFLIIRK